jgi:hypothetical protein
LNLARVCALVGGMIAHTIARPPTLPTRNARLLRVAALLGWVRAKEHQDHHDDQYRTQRHAKSDGQEFPECGPMAFSTDSSSNDSGSALANSGGA